VRVPVAGYKSVAHYLVLTKQGTAAASSESSEQAQSASAEIGEAASQPAEAQEPRKSEFLQPSIGCMCVDTSCACPGLGTFTSVPV
jgi:hypothetical protein